MGSVEWLRRLLGERGVRWGGILARACSPFIASSCRRRGSCRSSSTAWLQRASDLGEGGVLFCVSRRSPWWCWAAWAVPKTVGWFLTSVRPRRTAMKLAAVLGRGRAAARVRDVRGVVARREGAEGGPGAVVVDGEHGVLWACAGGRGACPCHEWHSWPAWARLVWAMLGWFLVGERHGRAPCS